MKDLRAFHVLALLGTIASAALVIGLVILTRHMDRGQRDGELRLVSSLVDSDLAAARTSALSLAKSDEAIRRLDHNQDTDWAAEKFQNPEIVQVWIYTFDYRDHFISGLHQTHGRTDHHFDFEDELHDQIVRLRETSFKHVPSGSYAVATQGFWSGGELYLLIAAPFFAASTGIYITHPTPPILAAVTPMKVFLRAADA